MNVRVCGIAVLCQPTTLSSSHGQLSVAVGGRSHPFGGRVLPPSFLLFSFDFAYIYTAIDITHTCLGAWVALLLRLPPNMGKKKEKAHWVVYHVLNTGPGAMQISLGHSIFKKRGVNMANVC